MTCFPPIFINILNVSEADQALIAAIPGFDVKDGITVFAEGYVVETGVCGVAVVAGAEVEEGGDAPEGVGG